MAASNCAAVMPANALSAARVFHAFKIAFSFSSLSFGEPAIGVKPFSRADARLSKKVVACQYWASRYLWQREALKKKDMSGAPCHAPENCVSSGAQAKRGAKSLGKSQILLWRAAFCHMESRQTSFLSQSQRALSQSRSFLSRLKGFLSRFRSPLSQSGGLLSQFPTKGSRSRSPRLQSRSLLS